MSDFRVANRGRVNRNRRVSFSFNGQTFNGFEGDTVASALLANGVHLVGRSFKYHRPRGILSAGSEEPNALLGVARGPGRFEPNTRATVLEISNGLKTSSQNHWPSLKRDVGAVNDALYMLFSAGFYYKTFMWPKSFWNKVYEPVIRGAAGLGKSPTEPDPDRYSSRFVHCDVLVVGSGPAGLAAALEAGRSGAKVMLVDEQAEFGGSLLSETDASIDGGTGWTFLEKAVGELSAMPNVTLLPRTTAFGYYHQNFVGLCQRLTDHLPSAPDGAPRERMWKVRAKQVVLAQGSIERPLVFHGNDRPGVMLAGSARSYLNRYGVKVGNEVVVVTSHDSAWLAALDLARAGVKVSAIVDIRSIVDAELKAEAEAAGIEVLQGWTVTGTKGRLRVESVRVTPVNGGAAQARTLSCDALLMSGGWTPSLHLFSHTQGKLEWREDGQTFLPATQKEECRCVGAGNGDFGLANALAGGANAGAAAAFDAGFPTRSSTYEVGGERRLTGVTSRELPTDLNPSKAKAFVDFQNDVTAKDIRLAVREGFRSIEHIKRYTTNGMATDQGKTSNINGLAIASDAVQRPAPAVGLTTFRPPYTPTTFGAFCGYNRGRLFDVTRKTAIDAWAEEHGAVFEPVSLWRRAWYFPKTGEDMHTAVARECKATRESVGIFDASTLGKIEIVGPDAAEFLNRMYTNPWTKLEPGRTRYGVLLGEDGFIRDDGVIGPLSKDRFHVTTTTGGAARVLNMMEDYLQTEFPELRVWLTSTTEQWSVIALNGPNARKLLEPLIEGIDLSDDAFPHMSIAEGKIAGVPTRLFRMSFTGERGYEVNVPARFGRAIWEKLIEAGKPYGITPYGTEAMHVLRAEKGYIIVGQDTDGTLTPDDAGLGWAIGKAKPDFVGKRSLSRPDMLKADRKQLVGLLTEDPKTVLEEGAQIVLDPNQPVPMKMVGHVTSSYWSVALGRSIALAVVEGGQGRMGETVHIPMPNETLRATVTGTVFFDPDNSRLSA
ncbi:sarcosine oxidase subunit alpha [Aureimonas phyllosphaerae]|uniref:Sarcosine oxidase subunit alpha n=1 Tax=Aureimonas phyllosphaerae TaxID=1166078 RepID=A0A7W6BSM8_9HYPH|nr:sarcosine oxidase subunit alpha [Aureimonas phyllosphaerae]MBB3935304.1 sarcosine oxidase subunit alpha [Aureimonas phyllosphaerae]MBB3959312.1 sarcosine oxidase subunit alpha [Aureimonas phyllosphaerae]SFF04874.1 sarcosine oxidase subunit alpha [Aureimonas phyllosphaerae]